MMAAQKSLPEKYALDADEPETTVVGAALEVDEEKDEHSADEADSMLEKKSKAIADVLDSAPLGRYHLFLALRQMFALVVFAMSTEVAAYTFEGLKHDLAATEEDLARFASVYSLGGMVGTVVGSALSDSVGRRTAILIATPAAGALHLCMALVNSMRALTALRCIQAAASMVVGASVMPWYSEFLPTPRRGQLLAVVSLGWPVGRGTLILVAEITKDSWRPLLALGGVGFFLYFLLMMTAAESPRYLVHRERHSEAHKVLGRMYSLNGGSWDPNTRLTMNADPTEKVATAHTAARLRSILCDHAGTISFSISIFAALSASTVLIDTYGPSVFKSLIAPTSTVLPHHVLQLFNAGDLGGIIVASFVADKIGRKGSFYVGFFIQAVLFGMMAFASRLVPSYASGFAIAMGTLASSCRCFGWEAAHFWTVEAFPTDLRATASGFATTCMRIFSIISLEISGKYVGTLGAETCIAGFALFLVLGGFIVMAAMPFETAGRDMAEGKGTKTIDE